MAASRTATQTVSTARTASGRLSFAKIREPLEVPDLLALQTESFDWLLGNERWQARVAAAKAAGRTDVPDRSGLEEIFEEISPIEDFSGSMSLSFRDHRFEETRKYSIEECKERDQTYAAPLFVTAEFMNTTTGEIKSQTVFMGDFPLMTERGTFIINGTERVVVSQLVRSPGVYFERTPDKTSDKDIYTAKVIPSRGAWLEFEIDKRDMVGVRVDRKRKQSVTVLLKALGWTEAQILEEFGELRVDAPDPGEGPHGRPGRRAARHLPQAAPGRAADQGGRPDPAGQPLLQRQALRPRQGRPLQDQQEARARRPRWPTRRCRSTTSSRRSSTSSPCTPARRPCRAVATARTSTSASRSTTSTTSATVASAPSASSSRTRSAPACPAWSASSASA